MQRAGPRPGRSEPEIANILDGNAKSLPRGTFVTLKGQVDTMRSSYAGLLGGLGVFHCAGLPAHRGQLSELDRSIHHHHCATRGAGRHCIVSLSYADDAECACSDGRHHVHGGRDGQQHPCGIVRQRFASTKHGNAVSAAIEAGATRFRPVIMTALAMIIGMVPMALGRGRWRTECTAGPRCDWGTALCDRRDVALCSQRLRADSRIEKERAARGEESSVARSMHEFRRRRKR